VDPPAQTKSNADYAIVTALPDELTAVLTIFGANEEVSGGSSDIRTYYRARVRCVDGGDQIIVCVCANSMGQHAALSVTGDAIRAWHPRHLLLVGIAGGVAPRKVNFGDVVVPHVIHCYEPSKLKDHDTEDRSQHFFPSAQLETQAQDMAQEVKLGRTTDWQESIGIARPDGSAGYPTVHTEELATGEQVWATLKAQEVQRVLRQYPKVIAVETEAAGIFNAVREAVRKPEVLVVKAFSDLVKRKNDRWREYAARASAAFALGLIKRLGGRWDDDLSAPPDTAPPSHFPLPHTTFVGRERELREISKQLVDQSARTVTLMGLGGIGKSRLALATAVRLRSHYTGGLFFCQLADARDSTSAMSAIAIALGATNVSQLAGQLGNHVANGPVLLVLLR
jgi:nucleoside phosphorylase